MAKNKVQPQKWIITSTRVNEKKSATSEKEQDNPSTMLRVRIAGKEVFYFGIVWKKKAQ
jgi:hypothetical protein